MERDEARRRFEKALVLAGYSTRGVWVDEGLGVESQAVMIKGGKGLRGFRAVLWHVARGWECMLSFRVWQKGEFPLTGDRLTREEGVTLKPYSLVLPKLMHIEPTLYRWEKEFDVDAVRLCVDQLCQELIKRNMPKKAGTLLRAMSHGDLGAATIGEALSMVQERWFPSREGRLLVARTWWRVMEPRITV